jgi:hypothetical protein
MERECKNLEFGREVIKAQLAISAHACNNMYPSVSASAPEISLDPVEHVSVSEAVANKSK